MMQTGEIPGQNTTGNTKRTTQNTKRTTGTKYETHIEN